MTFLSTIQRRLILLGGLVTLLLFSGYGAMRWYLIDRFETAAREHGFALTYGSFSVSPLRQSIALHDLHVQAETRSDSLQARVSDIHIRGIHWWPLLRDGSVRIGTVAITAPEVQLQLPVDTFSAGTSKPADWHVGEFQLQEGRILGLSGIDTLFWGEEINIRLEDVKSDFRQQLPSGQVEWKHAGYLLRSQERQLFAGPMVYHLQTGDIRIDSLALQDVKSPAACQAAREPYLHLRTDRCSFRQVDAKEIWEEGVVRLAAIALERPVFEIREVVRNYPPRQLPLPQAWLRQLSTGIQVDSLLIQNGQVDFRKFFPERQAAGNVSFDSVQASIENISNLPESIVQDSIMLFTVQALFMGEAPLEGQVEIDLSDSLDTHFCQGSLGQLPLKKINGMLTVASNFRIESGICEELYFTFRSNKYRSWGDVAFGYRNLKLDVTDGQTGIDLRSLVMNTFVIPSDNQIEEPGFRSGDIKYGRKRNRTIFHHWWHSIRSGIIHTLLV